MAGKYSPAAQQKLAAYELFMNDVARIHNLCEQYAVAKTGADNFKSALKRAAGQAKLKFMTSGKAQLSQICGAIELQSSRSGAQGAMARALREHVGNLRFQIDLEMRLIIKEDQEEMHAKKVAKEKAKASVERHAAEQAREKGE